jgi:erythromycin esterase
MLVQKKTNELLSLLQNTLDNLEKEFVKKNMYEYFEVIQRVLDNKKHLLSNLVIGQRSFEKIRDQIMANNLEWICKKLYPNEKVIIWAHNAHIYKNYETLFKYKPMGSLINSDIVNKSYYIGLFMYEGKASLNNRTIYNLSKPPKKSLEDYMNHNKSPISFLDLSNTSPNDYNKWIFNKTLILESGTMEKFITPAEQLDGIFFIKKVSPPHYL